MIRLLVVDDLADDFELARIVLKMHGLEVEARRVDTPDTLESALAEQDWDVLLFDWVMPHLTTPEGMRIVRASRQPDVPAIVWTGQPDDKVAAIALEVLKARAFLPKAQYRRLPEIVVRACQGRP